MANNKVSKRSANYTNREIHIIMEEYIRRKNILENNSSPQQNMDQKRRAWVEIADHVNVISPTKRTYTEVRRKVSDMKCSAKRKMLRYLKQSLTEDSRVSLVKPQIDERLLEILQENGVIPPYKIQVPGPEPVQAPTPSQSGEDHLSFGSTVSVPVSVGEVSCPPSVTVETTAVADPTHTPSSGYDTQPDPNTMKHLRESVDRLTASVDKLGDTLIKISRSLEKIVESNQQMFNTINTNVVRILDFQHNVQTNSQQITHHQR